MSGIYIPGMEMPKDDCEAYRQIIITNNLVDGKIQMLAHDANTNEFIGEVVELPPHGRVIDADKIGLTNFEIILCQNGNPFKNALEMLLEKIENAPTLIEAEEGEW